MARVVRQHGQARQAESGEDAQHEGADEAAHVARPASDRRVGRRRKQVTGCGHGQGILDAASTAPGGQSPWHQ